MYYAIGMAKLFKINSAHVNGFCCHKIFLNCGSIKSDDKFSCSDSTAPAEVSIKLKSFIFSCTGSSTCQFFHWQHNWQCLKSRTDPLTAAQFCLSVITIFLLYFNLSALLKCGERISSTATAMYIQYRTSLANLDRQLIMANMRSGTICLQYVDCTSRPDCITVLYDWNTIGCTDPGFTNIIRSWCQRRWVRINYLHCPHSFVKASAFIIIIDIPKFC